MRHVFSLLLTAIILLHPQLALAGSIPDLDESGFVDIFDYNILVSNFGGPYTIYDYNILVSQFGQAIATPTPVPAPSLTPSPTPVGSLPTPPPLDPNKVLVGVRFFPGFPSTNHTVRNAQSQLLSEPGWSHTHPYFTIQREGRRVQIDEDDQRVIDQEIQLAAKAGLDYWALEIFSTAGSTPLESFGYNYHLKMYMQSSYRQLLRFTLFLSARDLQNADWQTAYADKLIPYLNDPMYLSVNTHPLLYLRQFDPLLETLGDTGAKDRVLEFKNYLTSRLGRTPFLIMSDHDSRNSLPLAKSYGMKARTSYLGGIEYASSNGSPYSSLVSSNQNQWDAFAGSDLEYLPLVTLGYDTRAKALDPVLYNFGDNPTWFQQGSPSQLASHVQTAINWVNTYQKNSLIKSVLLAAWSDPSESGWLIPTLKEGNARLNALSQILGGQTTPVPTSPYAADPPPPIPPGELTITNLQSGSRLPAGPFHLTGKGPNAARVNLRFHGSNNRSYFFLNGKSTYPNRNFDIIIYDLPAGTYTLSVSGDVLPFDLSDIHVDN